MLWWKNTSYQIALLFFWIVTVHGSIVNAQSTSVLNSGQWIKIEITETGIYKINADWIRKAGIDPSTFDPRNLQLYGNGPTLLPQAISSPRPVDLIQNAVWVEGEEDGKLDPSDALYFYAEGPNTIQYDSSNRSLTHQIHYYSAANYYFLTVGSQPGLRVQEKPQTSDNAYLIDQYDDYWFYENQTFNLLHSGREWWGEYLGLTPSLTVPFSLPDVVPDSKAILRLRGIASAQVATKLIGSVNGHIIGEQNFTTVPTGTYDVKAVISKKDYSFTYTAGATSATSVTVTFDKNGQSSASAYLDYLALQVKRYLKYGDQTQIFRFVPGAVKQVKYRLQTTSRALHVWDISRPAIPGKVALQTGTESDVFFSNNDGDVFRSYLAFSPSAAKNPGLSYRISNQTIRSSPVPDLLIITAPSLLEKASQLANLRRQQDNLDVEVVTTDQIYNEFSSGKADVTAIRDFVRHLYRSQSGKLKYLLLFGDATYDYKNHLELTFPAGHAFVPTYESIESLDPVASYSSDDYFGFLEDHEGQWAETNTGNHTLDIGIGRIPVKNPGEAQIFIDKLTHYATSPATRRNWRNRIMFVADDGDFNLHQQHADALATMVEPQLLPTRLFIDAFPQTTTDEGQKSPQVQANLRKGIEEGTLILNYTGHGGVSGWAEEQILTLKDMLSLRGYNNLPLLITATCEFGRYDNPSIVSGAELLALSPKGASIGSLTTTRPVYASNNFTLNKAFYSALLQQGASARLGDLMVYTKNNSLDGSRNRNFVLLGDPSMRLARAEYQIKWDVAPDTLRALQKVTLRGKIADGVNGSDLSTFNGHAQVSVFDKRVSFRTLGGSENTSETYQEIKNKLFEGTVSVTGGKFKIEFIVPRDIDYRIGEGRISIYALSSDSLSDAAGQLPIQVGGSLNTPLNTTSPVIKAYLNTNSFRDGDEVTPTPVLWVDIFAENGINLSTSGLNHSLTAQLNDTISYDLSPYFTSLEDDFKKGVIRFPFEELPTGNYVIKIKVWDTHTNSAETTFRFKVGKEQGVQLISSVIFPNPFKDELSFEIAHNRENEDIEIDFRIITLSGQTVFNFQKMYFNSSSKISETVPVNAVNTIQSSGIHLYLYELSIRSSKDGSSHRKTGKIIHKP